MDYSLDDLRKAYKALGVKKGSTVLFKSNLFNLGFFTSNKKNDILNAHFEILENLIDLTRGNIVVMTSSTYLCNTDIPYDHENTKSERGIFSEYVREKKNTIRSFHPFMSYAAIGKDSEYICSNVSNIAWGNNSVKERLINFDTKCLSIGIDARLTCSTVHHAEYNIDVPYRYLKMFNHPIKTGTNIINKKYYMHVLYKNLNIKRNRNIKIFEHFLDEGFELRKIKLGRNFGYSYDIKDFYQSTIRALKKDIFIWLDEKPNLRKNKK